MTSRIILIETDPVTVQTFRDSLANEPIELLEHASVDAAVTEPDRKDWGVIVASLAACSDGAPAALAKLRERAPGVPIFLIAPPGDSLPAQTDVPFEVVRAPVRPELPFWIADAVLNQRPSHLFKLYVSGSGEYAHSCAERVRRMLDRSVRGGVELEVVNVLSEPHRARWDEVRATPTLVRVGPKPRRQVVGVNEARIARIWDPAEVRW